MALKFAAGMGAGSGATILDDSGGGHPLTVGSGSYTASGHTGPGFQNTLGTNTTGASGTVPAVSGSACTLMAWVNPSSLPTNGVQLICGAMQTSGSTDFAIWCQRGDFSTHNVLQGDARLGGGVVAANGTAMTVGTWAHVALTFDGANLKLWLNGTVVATVANTGTLSSTTNFVIAGMNLSGVSSTGPGVVDDVRYFDSDESAAMTTWMNTPVTGSSSTVVGAVSFTAKGAVAASGVRASSGAINMAAAGSVTIPAAVTKPASVGFAAAGSVSATAVDIVNTTAAFQSTGTLTAGGVDTANGAAVFAATANVAIPADDTTFGAVAITAAASLAASAVDTRFGVVTIGAAGTITLDGQSITPGAVGISAAGATTFAATIITPGGAVVISASTVLTPASTASRAATVPFMSTTTVLIHTGGGRDIALMVRPILGRWLITPVVTGSTATTTLARLEDTPL